MTVAGTGGIGMTTGGTPDGTDITTTTVEEVCMLFWSIHTDNMHSCRLFELMLKKVLICPYYKIPSFGLLIEPLWPVVCFFAIRP